MIRSHSRCESLGVVERAESHTMPTAMVVMTQISQSGLQSQLRFLFGRPF